ncbi:MAG: flagellar export chaperone FliS [Gammaproteobacteria bacterium]|nr:flagellar export chaperone FliS [Gammaproteobacteria bacterium]
MMSTGSPVAMQAYKRIGITTEIETATPHRLIQLMMARVLTKISLARNYMERKAIAEKGAHIGDAISIIDGLQASLNHKPDKRLAGNFDALYDYMKRQLVQANLKNEPSLLDEVAGLMRELKEAWDAIGAEVDGEPGQAD